MNKICTSCNKELPANKDYFFKQKKGKHGLRGQCKDCAKEYRKKYQSTDDYKKKHRDYMSKWREENPEESKKVSNKSRNKHKEKINKTQRDKYKNDIEYRDRKYAIEKIYKESGRRYEVQSTPEQREKARIRSSKRRENKEYRCLDAERSQIYRNENKDFLNKLHKKYRHELKPSYIAQTIGISVKDLSPDIYETKKIIIQLKRELKNNNIKIR